MNKDFIKYITMIIVAGIIIFLLAGCQEAKSNTDKWEGWSNEAAYLAKHYDQQLGVVCYLSTRPTGSYARNPLSCVKL